MIKTMTKTIRTLILTSAALLGSVAASAQYRTDEPVKSESADTVYLTLDQALQIALSENVSVKVADKEIERYEYAKKGTYASLFPQVDGTGSYQRTIKKQVMYMDTGSYSSDSSEEGDDSSTSSLLSSDGGISVGRQNTYSAGVSATMPLVAPQTWKNIQISGQQVELAVEQARSSRLSMVNEVKKAYYEVLLAKESFYVYKEVYENALQNFKQTEQKFNAEKASELEYFRAKSTVANAIPDVYNAESSIMLALWQLKAVMGIDLDTAIDVLGTLDDYANDMYYDIDANGEDALDNNTEMRQLELQAEMQANTVKMQKYAYIPTLSASFSYTYNAMTNDFKFSNYRWTPYSYAGLSLSIPIFSGGKRYNDVRAAKVQAEELNLQLVEKERELRISINQYLNTMQTNIKSRNAAEEAVVSAQKAYDISVKSYNVGRSTITDLNDAQLSLTQSKLQVSQAIYNFLVAKSELETTLGNDFIDEEGNYTPDMK